MPENYSPSHCVESPDAELERLRAQIVQQAALIEQLGQRIEELVARLAKDSHNSSKPPSSDGLNRPKPKSQRRKGLNSTGGQTGHPGHTLKRLAQPDYIERHLPPGQCDACGRLLPEAEVVEARQVFDIPPLRHDVTEHQVLEARCACGKLHRGAFPVDVAAPGKSRAAHPGSRGIPDAPSYAAAGT